MSTSPLGQPPMLPPPTLDLSSLTDEDQFTTESDWINDLLSSSSDSDHSLASLDSTLSKTLNALQVATHDTSSLVDRTILDISRSVPRLTFDLQLMRENALLLHFTLNAIRTRSGSGGDSEVSKVMDKLRVLDLVKSRMEAARDVLREAESWSTLESEVTGLVGEQAYGKAAERLEEAARSMVVFHNTTEWEGRRALMVSLQNQLEAALSASLVVAIQGRDVKACQAFHAIFGQIQREAEFTAYYFGSRRSALIESWTSAQLLEEEEDHAASATGFTTFLTTFYHDFHTLLTEERTYLPTIFPSPLPTLSSFIQSTIESLHPSLPDRLTSLANHRSHQVLPELIRAYRATEEFAVGVERIAAKLGAPPVTPAPAGAGGGGGGAAAPATPSRKSRRLSQRMSVSKRLSSRSISFGTAGAAGFGGAGQGEGGEEGGEGGGGGGGGAESIRPWETAIFEPFLDWQVDYPTLEQQYLSTSLARESSANGKQFMAYLGTGESEKGAKVLGELVGGVFGLAEEGMGRMLSFTHGYGAAGLVRVLERVLSEFMEARRGELERAAAAGAGGGAGARGKRRGGDEREDDVENDDDEAVLEGLEYSMEDWSTFQFGLRLLDTCRSMTDKLSTFESKLKSRLTVLAHTVREAREDPRGYTIPGTTRGAVTMLRQSTLNSVELASLLDPLERPHEGPSSTSSAFSPPLLPKARYATSEFTRATQLFLHETMLAPLLSHLASYASLPSWTSTSSSSNKGAFDLSIPVFSLSPTETISRVGEGLFNLPRLFEVYADDDALAFSIETLPFVDGEALRGMMMMGSTPSPPSAPMHRTFDSLSQPPPSPSLNRRPPAPSASTTPLSAETVITTWLTSLTLSILSHLTTHTLPCIPRLSALGAKQLGTDLDYIANVARALDVQEGGGLEGVEGWREWVGLEEKGWREMMGEEGEGERGEVGERVGRMRGWRLVVGGGAGRTV